MQLLSLSRLLVSSCWIPGPDAGRGCQGSAGMTGCSAPVLPQVRPAGSAQRAGDAHRQPLPRRRQPRPLSPPHGAHSSVCCRHLLQLLLSDRRSAKRRPGRQSRPRPLSPHDIAASAAVGAAGAQLWRAQWAGQRQRPPPPGVRLPRGGRRRQQQQGRKRAAAARHLLRPHLHAEQPGSLRGE